ncbi:hypothetical protein B0H13DRAFT_1855792 [Mycena leptocephala]|nr:hypothetical protein B0H13DRAFT_1855792 [Mycena leptocephala]
MPPLTMPKGTSRGIEVSGSARWASNRILPIVVQYVRVGPTEIIEAGQEPYPANLRFPIKCIAESRARSRKCQRTLHQQENGTEADPRQPTHGESWTADPHYGARPRIGENVAQIKTAQRVTMPSRFSPLLLRVGGMNKRSPQMEHKTWGGGIADNLRGHHEQIMSALAVFPSAPRQRRHRLAISLPRPIGTVQGPDPPKTGPAFRRVSRFRGFGDARTTLCLESRATITLADEETRAYVVQITHASRSSVDVKESDDRSPTGKPVQNSGLCPADAYTGISPMQSLRSSSEMNSFAGGEASRPREFGRGRRMIEIETGGCIVETMGDGKEEKKARVRKASAVTKELCTTMISVNACLARLDLRRVDHHHPARVHPSKTTAPQKFQPNTQVQRHTAQKIIDTVRGDVLESDQRHRAALELNSGSQARIKFGAIGAWEGLDWRGRIRIWCRTRLDTMRRDRWRALHALYYIGHYTSAIVDVVSFERLPVGWCFKPYCTVN